MAKHRTLRTWLRAGLGLVMTAATVAGLVVAPTAVSAATFDGLLGIHGPGSLFAGTHRHGQSSDAVVSLVVAPGGTATFPAEVVNLGTSLSQYRVAMNVFDPS